MKPMPKQIEDAHSILCAMRIGSEMHADDLVESAKLLEGDSKARSNTEANAAEEREVVSRLAHAIAIIDAYQRVEALLVNLDAAIASMRECDRKQTKATVAAELRRALYGEE